MQQARQRPRVQSGTEACAEDSRQFWYVVIVAAFWAITGLVVWRLWPQLDVNRLLTPMNLLVFGLAAYRGGRILARDDVARPLRAPFVDVEWEEGDSEPEETPKPQGFRGAIGGLLTCPDCAGFWMGAVLVYAYLFWPGPAAVVALILAVSGVGQIGTAIVSALQTVIKRG